jgi:hypothetical protein
MSPLVFGNLCDLQRLLLNLSRVSKALRELGYTLRLYLLPISRRYRKLSESGS